MILDMTSEVTPITSLLQCIINNYPNHRTPKYAFKLLLNFTSLQLSDLSESSH